jgi:hypothetical protein
MRIVLLLLALVFLFAILSGCDAGRPLSNAQIIAAKVECEAGGMKVQVHLRNSHAVTAVCVPLSVYDHPAPVSVQGSTGDTSYSRAKHNFQADKLIETMRDLASQPNG